MRTASREHADVPLFRHSGLLNRESLVSVEEIQTVIGGTNLFAPCQAESFPKTPYLRETILGQKEAHR